MNPQLMEQIFAERIIRSPTSSFDVTEPIRRPVRAVAALQGDKRELGGLKIGSDDLSAAAW